MTFRRYLLGLGTFLVVFIAASLLFYDEVPRAGLIGAVVGGTVAYLVLRFWLHRPDNSRSSGE